MRFSIPLKAGQPLRQFFYGRCIAILKTGVASEVTLTAFGASQQDTEDYGAVARNFSVYNPDAAYSGAEFTATVDTTIEIIVSNARVEILDGSSVTISGTTAPVQTTAPGVTWTDRSGAIAVGATAQQLAAANAGRRGMLVQNLSATDALWLSDQGAATQDKPSIKVPALGYWETPATGCPVAAISIIGPTGGQKFSAREW